MNFSKEDNDEGGRDENPTDLTGTSLEKFRSLNEAEKRICKTMIQTVWDVTGEFREALRLYLRRRGGIQDFETHCFVALIGAVRVQISIKETELLYIVDFDETRVRVECVEFLQDGFQRMFNKFV